MTSILSPPKRKKKGKWNEKYNDFLSFDYVY